MAAINPVLKDQAAPEIVGIFDKMTKRLGFMPNFFATLAHRPNVLKSFLDLYKAIMNEGTVEARFKELAYLKTAMINGCEYCTKAHIASGKKAGLTDDDVQGLLFYQRNPRFSDKDKAVILYAERVTRGASAIRPGAVEELKKYFTEDQIVELTMVIAVANFTNRMNDATMVTPDLG
jgi:uncharacterized peroxidase-related enzyme